MGDVIEEFPIVLSSTSMLKETDWVIEEPKEHHAKVASIASLQLFYAVSLSWNN